MTRVLELEERFWSKVDYDPYNPGRCWPWTDGVQRGYGIFHFRDVDNSRVAVRPHRQAYVLTFGEIAAGSSDQIDHICHNPQECTAGDACPHRRCCNPDHMVLANGAENSAPDRMVRWQTLKTHCPQGHEYSAANTYFHKNGHRACRACNRDRARARARRLAVS